jgi:hypothetical protein
MRSTTPSTDDNLHAMVAAEAEAKQMTLADYVRALLRADCRQSASMDDNLINELKAQLQVKDTQIERLQSELSESRQRSDTIILQLTRQFEAQTKLIEDMRHRSLWARVKTAFGCATS